jgi:hypothetical protein
MSASITDDDLADIRFMSAAIAYARRNGIPHQVTEPREARRVIRAYGDNFSARRREPWSH